MSMKALVITSFKNNRSTVLAALMLVAVLLVVAMAAGQSTTIVATFAQGVGAVHTGDVTTTPCAFAELTTSLAPIQEPLSMILPESRIVAYDLGAHPGMVLKALGSFAELVAPAWHRLGSEHLDEFTRHSGLDPERDYLPCLGRDLTWALLPSAEGEAWSLPRPVTLLRVEDEPCARRFLHEFLRWKAGAMAPFTGGLVSAMVVEGVHEGIEIEGLQVEGLYPLPLPSPAYAVVDGVLVVSPVRSATEQVVSALVRKRSDAAREQAQVSSGSVELFSADLSALAAEWQSSAALVPAIVAASGAETDPDRIRQIGDALFGYLGTLGYLNGSTVIAHDGRLVGKWEARPPGMNAEWPQRE